jgi:hypothetical protein
MDGRYVRGVRRRFATIQQRNFHNFGLWDYLYYAYVKGIRVEPLLNHLNYEHESVDQILKDEVDWTYYGGHHHESYYTRFVQSYLLPRKFNIDRRRTELSALIRSGQADRGEALKTLAETAYAFDDELVDYALSKLGLTRSDFDAIMAQPAKSFRDYPSYFPLIKACRLPIRVACNLGLVPRLLYLKFLG